jgi:hypothetical protein
MEKHFVGAGEYLFAAKGTFDGKSTLIWRIVPMNFGYKFKN